ncbi:hypothetical protein [uncultured Kordia sp.]|uniref:hypothetical protein n=1 Tax=uncultured Kordia sp. TaxID=507699 RepID=UPI00260C6C6F|nr:hypothetical protein [uncultured Kordia sp.]
MRIKLFQLQQLNLKKYLFILSTIFFFGCEVENIEYKTPYVFTDAPTSILTTSAILGGRVLGEGGKDVLEYGVVWSQQFPPTVQDSKRIEGTRLGVFSNRYEAFQPNTTYYFAAYATNEVGTNYGDVYEFITDNDPPCSPTQQNRINLGQSSINITDVSYENPPGFNDGNVEFEASSYSSTARITLQFNEIDGVLPFTGEYTTVTTFDTLSTRSNGEVILTITDFGFGSLGGGIAASGENIYITNNGTDITFTFCNVEVGSQYVVTGKYTYSE